MRACGVPAAALLSAGLVTGSFALEAAQGDAAVLAALLAKAAAYVARFTTEFSSAVAEEHYVQQASGGQTIVAGRGRGGTIGTTSERRELLSDFLLVKPPGMDMWVPFRDVFEVDGRPVREREERLTKLLLTPGRVGFDLAAALLAESARYNIGNVQRTLNMPLIAITFLDEGQQPRFEFELGKVDPSLGARDVSFRERAKPTRVRTPDGRNLFSSGRVWIDEATGRVVRTELIVQDAALRAAITTSFRADDRFAVDVPAEMVEEYILRNRSRVTGRATYTRFRRFEVSATEEIPLPSVQ